MSIKLTDAHIAALAKSPDTAELAQLLKEGEYVPKGVFNELIEKNKIAQAALDKIESDRLKSDADRAAKEKEVADAQLLAEKNYSQLIADRDKDIVDREAKIAAAAQVLASEQAKMAELATRQTALEDSQKKIRDTYLAKITDEEMRGIASKLPQVEDVMAFVEKIGSTKSLPFSGKHPPGTGLTIITNKKTQQEYLQGK